MGRPDEILTDEEGEIVLEQYGISPYNPIPTPPSSASLSPEEDLSESEPEYVDLRLTNDIKTHYHYNMIFNYEKDADNLFAHYPALQRNCWKANIDFVRYKSRRNRFFKASKSIHKYWVKVMIAYESVAQQLQFPILASISESAESLNHLSAQIWMLTFAIKIFLASNQKTTWKASEETMDKLSVKFAQLIYECCLTEQLLRQFVTPVSRITEIGLDLFRRMRRTMLLQQLHPHAIHNTKKKPGFSYEGDYNQNLAINREDLELDERYYSLSKEARAPGKRDKTRTVNMAIIAKNMLLHENRRSSVSSSENTNNFGQLNLYLSKSRNPEDFEVKKNWLRFRNIPTEFKLEFITDSLQELIGKVRSIREETLKPLLKLLKQADKRSYFVGKPTLLRHLNIMASFLIGGTIQFVDFLVDDETQLIKDIVRGELHLNNIIDGGKEIIRQNLEILAVSQLCYTFLRDGLEAPMEPYQVIIDKMYRSQENKKEKENAQDELFLYNSDQFTVEDFSSTKYHEALRQIPVYIGGSYLVLHKRNNDDADSESTIATVAQLQKSKGQL